MADLRELLTDLGYEDVRTVLASGNVIFTGPKAKARATLEKGLEERFGFKVDVVLRTMDEVRAVIEDEPFGDEVDNLTRYFVVFLPSTPDLSALEGQDFAPDKYAANGHEIYAWCPEGMQNSRLMKALGKPGLATTATVRNMATVKKLLE
jgi:uncharacterized protein (DUF1697 family)